MSITASQLAWIRRNIDEDANSVIYTDALITEMFDERGDVNLVAADIWLEKANKMIGFDFAADGGDFKRSQLHSQYMANYEMYSKSVKTIIGMAVVTPPASSYVPIVSN